MQNIHTLPLARQRGVALFVVIIFVMLSMLLALWASRTAWFNEMIVSNDADYQRAYEAALALLQDAELDIRGEQASGAFCTNGNNDNPDLCRKGQNVEKFPTQDSEIGILLARLNDNEIGGPTKCRHAICVKRTAEQDFWNNENKNQGITLIQMQALNVGARYGQYTGAATGAAGNPILADRRDGRGGWYWIEVLPYAKGVSSSELISESNNGSPKNILDLSLKINVIYRITALAQGLKPNTMVVLQQTYALKKQKN